MPMIEPATAVAISQRKNSCPILSDSRYRDPQHRLSGLFECFYGAVLPGIEFLIQAQVNENPITPVNIGRACRLSINRYHSSAFFTGGLAQEAAPATHRRTRVSGTQ